MEASQAGLAGQGDGGQAEGGGEAPAYVTADQLAEHFGQFTQSQQQMLGELKASLTPQQEDPEPQAEEPGYDFSQFDEAGYDPEAFAEQMAGMFDQRLEQRVQERLGPLEQRLQEQEYDRKADLLAEEIPELRDENVLRETLTTAQELLAQNPSWDQNLINDPSFWRMAHFARRAADIANREGAETPSAAHLEGGGGATPASTQVDLSQRILNAGGGGRSVLPFG